MASPSQDQAKVVLIDTQYVTTDPRNFKSVVQSLTGKDSCVAWIDESAFTGAEKKRKDDDHGGVGISSGGGGGGGGGGGDCRLSKGLSFKDLDKVILELPPVEAWQHLWTRYNYNLL